MKSCHYYGRRKSCSHAERPQNAVLHCSKNYELEIIRLLTDLDIPKNSRSANTVMSGNGFGFETAVFHHLPRFYDLRRRHLGPAAKADAALAGGFESGAGALGYHSPLDMGEEGKDGAVKLSGFGSGVEVLGQADKTCAPFVKIGDDRHDMRNRAPKAVQLPDDQLFALAD